jgi:putative isomerase
MALLLMMAGDVLSQSTSHFQTLETKTDQWGRTPYSFCDMGAWHSYAAPKSLTDTLGFYGPWLMTENNGSHFAKFFGALLVTDPSQPVAFSPLQVTDYIDENFYNNLHLDASGSEIRLSGDVRFLSGRQSLTTYQLELAQNSTAAVKLVGKIDREGCKMRITDHGLEAITADSLTIITLHIHGFDPQQLAIDGNHFSYGLKRLNNSCTVTFDTHVRFKSEKIEWYEKVDPDLPHLKYHAQIHGRVRGENWAHNYDDYPAFQQLQSKCLSTLMSNWRSAAGELKHDGIFPSHHEYWFNGFWAWDSWKHAAGIAKFEPELAKDQIRAMLDYQNEKGMIADCIFRDTLEEQHNWRNSKPPLLGWSIFEVFQSTHDTDFVREVMPAAVRYHRFWRLYRSNPILPQYMSYGSEDSTMIPAKWESGMDNAVRFDQSKLMEGRDGSYVLNQASVDLYCFLHADLSYIMDLMKVCGVTRIPMPSPEEIGNLTRDFFDEELGWFFDLKINNDGTTSFVNTFGPEGWIPLFTELADSAQVAAVVAKLSDEDYFNSYVPFASLAVNDPELRASDGYWRGPVWIDQAYFAVKGLRNYGYNELADEMTMKLFEHCEGLLHSDMPLRENYDPLTGEGLNAKHFSWTAACILLLMDDLNLDER